MKNLYLLYLLAALIPFWWSSCTMSSNNLQSANLTVSIADSLYEGNVSGKLIFLFSKDTSQSLIYGVNPSKPHPVFTYDVKNHNPKESLSIAKFTDWWFKTFSELEGQYAARLIFDCDTLSRSSFVTKGNSYSAKQIITLSGERIDSLSFVIKNKFNGWVFKPTKNISEIRFKSETLSKFWKQEMFIEAAIVLPESYKQDQQRRYPLVFVFPGFGSHHASITYGNGQINRYGMNQVGEDKIFVFCNGEFKNGYHHFTNSENNGPWADAFTQEFLPFIEKNYRTKGRFLMGQSSGAWTSAWLQVNYPELFTAAFVASPDPLDFRAMGNNIYRKNANFYFPQNADSAQIAKGEKDRLSVKFEHLVDEYGQIRTWEASFSPKDYTGQPAQLFNRESGEINPVIAACWKRFDISLKIKSDPAFFRNNLSGKIHFYVSEDDPYGLHQGVHLLETMCIENNIALKFTYLKGLKHLVWTDEVRKQIHTEIEGKLN